MSPSRSLTWLASVYKSALLKTNVQMLTKYSFRYFHQFWRICSSLYLIWKTWWRKVCICLNTTLKKLGGLTSKINITLIACMFLTRPAVSIQISPVPRKSAVVPADQHPDQAPDLWKYPYKFDKFPIIVSGLHFHISLLTCLACPVAADFDCYP